MLDKTQGVQLGTAERRRAGDYLLPIAFLGAASIAMFAWIAAIIWAS